MESWSDPCLPDIINYASEGYKRTVLPVCHASSLAVVIWFYLVDAGSLWEILHNPYFKGGVAMLSLLGPGRGMYNCFALVWLVHGFLC